MAITPWTIYWITRLGEIYALGGIMFCVSLVVLGACGLCYAMTHNGIIGRNDDECPVLTRIVKISIILCVIGAILGTFVPTAKQMAAMYVIPAVVNSKVAKKIPSQIEQLSDAWVQELMPQKREK